MNKYSKQIYEQYQEAIRKRKSKVVKFWFYITAFFALLSGVTFLFYHRLDIYMVLFFIFVGIFGILLIVLAMLALFYVSEKPLYEILYPKIVSDHNYEESTFIQYEPYPKDKDFFTFGGLYPTFSAKVLRFKLNFENTRGYAVDVYDAFVSTSSGNSTNVHLNGYYLVFRDYSDLKFQLRTAGAPSVSPKYIKLNDILDVRAYVDPLTSELDQQYINLYHLIKNEYDSPGVAIGCNGNDLHIGITLRPMRRRVKVLTEEIYIDIRRSLMQMIDLANTIK